MRFSHGSAAQSALASVFILVATLSASAQRSSRVPARVNQAVDPEKLVTLQGNVHPLARPQYDQGLAPDSLALPRMLLVLQRSADQETALRQVLVNQQVKSSPGFHQWLTPRQFGQQFGPADADIQAVTDWLASEGFQVNRVSNGRTVIEFSGTAGLVRQAFHTEIHQYMVNGESHWANSSNPQIPAALAPVVAGINSLNDFPRKPQSLRVGTFERTKATGEVKPLFTYTCPLGASGCGSSGETWYGVGPYDFATIYNVLPLWNQGTVGSGQTIAIVAQSNINCQDLASFRQLFGLSYTATSATNPCPNTFNIVLDGPDPGILGPTSPTADEEEAILDAEWTTAVAPGATIDLVLSETPAEALASNSNYFFEGTDLSAVYVVDNNLAPILSDSYGACEAGLGAGGNAFYNNLWEQAAAQGITVVVAAGDNGSAACDGGTEVAATQGLNVTGNASTPFNVAVGGTDFNDYNNYSPYWNTTNNSTTRVSALSYIPESTWSDSACAQNLDYGTTNSTTCSPDSGGSDLVGGGGGPSNCIDAACSKGYAKPSWQTGNGVPQENPPVRDVPDVSLFASNGYDGSFFIVCEADANTGSNTTSCDLNSPYEDFGGVGGTSASAQAFAGVMALVLQAQNGQRQGNANFVLYPLAKYAANNGGYCTSSSSAVTNTSCIFYDVNTGNDSVACEGGSPNCSTAIANYGILVNPYLTTLSPAWLAGSGYDYATGLGTVNVANLVNNWNKVSFTPTATHLSLSPTSFTHGASTSVTVNVAPQGTGTPTGDVSLIGCQKQTVPCPAASLTNPSGIAFATLPGGANSVTWSTQLLPAGTYWVNAHYAGDGTYGSSDSNQVQVNVSKENSVTQVSTVNAAGTDVGSGASYVYGAPYVLRVDVTNASGTQCSTTGAAGAANGFTSTPAIPCPTGTVKVSPTPTDEESPPTNTPGTYPLNSEGFTQDQFIQYPAGSYPAVTATYPGDNSYNTSTSAAYALTITQAPTSIVLSESPQNGGTFALTATVCTNTTTCTSSANSAGLGFAPTGTVQFFNGGAAISGTPVYTGVGYNPVTGAYAYSTWVLTTTFTANATVTAKYTGDTNYMASPVSNTVTVNATPDFGFTAPILSASVVAGSSATYSLTLTSAYSFNSAVSLTCTVATPSGFSGTLPTCSLNPSSVTPPSNGSTPSTLTVGTTARSLAPPAGDHRPRPTPTPVPLFLLGPLAMLLLAWMILALAKRRRVLVGVTLAGMLLLLALGLASCGGGGSTTTTPPPPTGTPAGTYSVTVTGTSSSLSHQIAFTLNVQ